MSLRTLSSLVCASFLVVGLVLTTLVGLVSHAYAQRAEPAASPSSAALETDGAAEIEAVLDRAQQAHERHDAQALGDLYCSEGFVGIAAPPGRPGGALVAARQQALNGISRWWGESNLRSHRFVERSIDVRGEWAWLGLTVVDHFDGQPDQIQHVHAVAARCRDEWRMCFTMPELARVVVLVVDVAQGSAAQRAGVAAGDLVIGCAGEPVQSLAHLERRIKSMPTGGAHDASVTLVIRRGNDERRFDVPVGESGLRCEERLLPAGDAVFVDVAEPHAVKELMLAELAACKAGSRERMAAMLCPAGFLALDPAATGAARFLDADRYCQSLAPALSKLRQRLDLDSAEYQGMRLIVKGDVALAANRFVTTTVGDKPEKVIYPSVLEVYVRQNDKWWLTAILPWRIEIGTHLWAVAVRSPEETTAIETNIRGEMVGIGVRFEAGRDGMVVKKVYRESPAALAGVKDGDLILEVDGQNLAGRSSEQGVALIRGPRDSVVTLVLRSPVGEQRTVSITRAPFTFSGVDWRMLSNRVGLIEIATFNRKTPDDVRRALSELAANAAGGIVLDLRGSAGGPYDAIVQTAELFIPDGQTLWYLRPVGGKAEAVKSTGKDVTRQPVVVLVDSRTAGGELIAAAIKANRRGRIVGQRTPGGTSHKDMLKRPDGSSELVVRAEYLIAPKKPITGRGVEPDLALSSEATPQEALDRAVEVLREQLSQTP